MKRLTITSLALVVLIAAAVSAQVPAAPMQGKAFAEQLALTQEQKDRISSIRSEWQKEKIMIQADMKLANLELRELMRNRETSENDLKSKMEKVSDHRITLRLGQRKVRNAVRDVLTPEQQELLDNRPHRRAFNSRKRDGRMNRGMGRMGDMRMNRGYGRQHFRGNKGYDNFNPSGGKMRFRGWDDEFIPELYPEFDDIDGWNGK